MAVNGERNFDKFITLDDLNDGIIRQEYALRGPLYSRANEIEKDLERGVAKPFKEVLKANVGDCHAMGQQPITFIRQVIALVSLPSLLDDPKFPEDAKKRAKNILKDCSGHSVGSYSESAGIEIIRKHVAEFIEKRDGIPSNYLDCILFAGATEAIRNVVKILVQEKNGKRLGMMIPIPQYPVYSTLCTEYNIHKIGYYLDESRNWALDIEELQRAIDEAKSISNPKILVVINPGNPTGQVLTRENIEEIIKFADRERLLILADEVYQQNIHASGSKFYSVKKILMEMGPPYKYMELVSFMSASKGYMGECGLRGGYAEVVNFSQDVKSQLLKSIITTLCPAALGQVVVDCVVNPPQPGEPSYELFVTEKENFLQGLKIKAKMVTEILNTIPGMSCNEVQGAMYAFPRIYLPPKAIEVAKKLGYEPDEFYVYELLENTGICIMPGSGFGQKPGTYHFRTTTLPPTDKIKEMLGAIKKFHKNFMEKYS